MGGDSESEASRGGAAAATTPSIDFAALGFDSCSTSFKVTPEGSGVGEGTEGEPYNGRRV